MLFLLLMVITTGQSTEKKKTPSSCQQWVQTTMQYAQGLYLPGHWRSSVGIGAKSTVMIRDYLFYPVLNFLNPLPMRLLPSPTKKIFLALWQDAHFLPTSEQWQILERFHLTSAFLQRQQFLQSHPSWHRHRRSLRTGINLLHWTSAGLGTLLIYQQLQSEMINLQQLLNDPKWQLAPHQVQIINETVPFPHTALRIGNTVYSYGQRHLNIKSIQEYLAMRDVAQLLRDRYQQDSQIQDRQGKQSWDLNQTITKLGLERLPQSLQIITLNLTLQQVGKLQRYLELQMAKEYYNVTFVNDCTTMTLRALSLATDFKFSRLMDASPAQMMMYFSALLALKDRRVSSITQVVLREDFNQWGHLARNSYINILESRIFLDLMWFNQIYRLWIDLTVKELEWYNPEVLAVIQEWEKFVEEELATNPQIKIIDEKFRTLNGNSEQCTNLTFLVENALADQVQYWEKTSNSLHADFKTITFNQLRTQQFLLRQQDWLAKLAENCQ